MPRDLHRCQVNSFQVSPNLPEALWKSWDRYTKERTFFCKSCSVALFLPFFVWWVPHQSDQSKQGFPFSTRFTGELFMARASTNDDGC